MAISAVLAFGIALGCARLIGYSGYVVTSGSMAPAIAVGSLIVVEATRPETVRVDDVITYTLPDRVVTHRVRLILPTDGRVAFQTRGDANDAADPLLVEPDRDVGAVRVVIPFAGFVVAAAQAWWRVIALVLLAWVLVEVVAVRLRGRLGPHAMPHAAGG